jgi:hypothetical protein
MDISRSDCMSQLKCETNSKAHWQPAYLIKCNYVQETLISFLVEDNDLAQNRGKWRIVMCVRQ